MLYQFNLDMMFPQKFKEAHKSLERISFSLQVSIIDDRPEMPNRTGVKTMIYSIVELRETAIRQHQIPGQNWGTGSPQYKIKWGEYNFGLI